MACPPSPAELPRSGLCQEHSLASRRVWQRGRGEGWSQGLGKRNCWNLSAECLDLGVGFQPSLAQRDSYRSLGEPQSVLEQVPMSPHGRSHFSHPPCTSWSKGMRLSPQPPSPGLPSRRLRKWGLSERDQGRPPLPLGAILASKQAPWLASGRTSHGSFTGGAWVPSSWSCQALAPPVTEHSATRPASLSCASAPCLYALRSPRSSLLSQLPGPLSHVQCSPPRPHHQWLWNIGFPSHLFFSPAFSPALPCAPPPPPHVPLGASFSTKHSPAPLG